MTDKVTAYLTFANGKLAAHQELADAEALNAKENGDVIITNVEELLEAKAITGEHITTLYNIAAKAVDPDVKDVKSLGKDLKVAGTKLFAALDAAFGTPEANTAAELEAAVKPAKKERKKKDPAEKSGPTGEYAGRFWVVAPVEEKPRRPPAERGNPARGYNSMRIIRENPGISTEKFMELGGRLRDLNKDFKVNHNVLEVLGDEAARAEFVKQTLAQRAEEDKKAEAAAKAAAEQKVKDDAAKAEAKAKKEAADKAAAEKAAADAKAGEKASA